MKIHYTIYNGNYDKGENTRPICNDNERMWNHQLTRDINEVTCKRCMKSIIAGHNIALEINRSRNLFGADHVEKMHNENRVLKEKLK